MKKCVLIIFMGCVFGANAIEFNVTTSNDTTDANLADGLCLDSNGQCSLRAAIMQSNILGTDEVIYLQRSENYVLTLADDIDNHAVNDLDVFDSLTISVINPELPLESFDQMPSISIIDDASINDRVLEIHAGELISINGVFIGFGQAENSLSNPRLGGGIYVSAQVNEFRIINSVVAFNQAGFGAGIYSDAEKTLIESTDVSYNTINIPPVITLGAAGAGVYHGGSDLTINKSSVHQNFVDEVGFFLSAVFLTGDNSNARILNTLIAENGVWPSGESGVLNGVSANQVDVRINNSNITGNSGVGVRFFSDDENTITIRNTVLAFNELNDCGELTGINGIQDFGGFLNSAHIISSDGSCSLPELANNLENVDPNLSDIEGRFEVLDFQFFSFQYPMNGSVLIDTGSEVKAGSDHISACESTDIFGVIRPLNGGGLFNTCDIGVYELGDLIFKSGYEFID